MPQTICKLRLKSSNHLKLGKFLSIAKCKTVRSKHGQREPLGIACIIIGMNKKIAGCRRWARQMVSSVASRLQENKADYETRSGKLIKSENWPRKAGEKPIGRASELY
jgi:hypothetical protein